MTKRYGALVGTPKQAVPPSLVDAAYQRTMQEILVRDRITLAASQIADTISVQSLGWESVLDTFDCQIQFDNLGAGSTLSFGDVTYPAGLDAAFATSAANAGKQLCSAPALSLYGAPLWQMLGYATLAAAKAVGDRCELLFTQAGGAANGNVSWRLSGARRGT